MGGPRGLSFQKLLRYGLRQRLVKCHCGLVGLGAGLGSLVSAISSLQIGYFPRRGNLAAWHETYTHKATLKP